MKSNVKSMIALPAVTLLTLLVGACATTADHNDMLEQARMSVGTAERNTNLAGQSQADLVTAQQALSRGDALLKAGKPVAEVDHQAYIAQRFALAAQKGAELAVSEKAIGEANNRRNAVLLSAREADAARANDVAARKTAEAAAAQTDAANSARQAESSARESMAAQQRANEAQQRASELEAAMADLKAKKTDQGMVITLGDVLFASGGADLKSNSVHSLDKLGAFLQQYPDRNVRIEGFTDSVGSEQYNQDLSERRAGSVRDALTRMGVAASRLEVRGYGKGSPVAGNDTATGRQQNRRVEVIILDDPTAVKQQ